MGQAFASNIDIANRACQHCGVTRIDQTLGFTEDTPQASEFGFNYDKLRRAELQRNVWKFATRNAVIRPVGTGMMLIQPTLWQSTTTYTFGAIVADANGVLWQSLAQDNLNNGPGGSSAWEVYGGPMTAVPYDSTGATGYFAGEIVYETPGDGTFAAYISLQSNNSQDPRAASMYQPTTQYQRDQVVQQYPAWAVGTSYAAGAGVSFTPAGTAAPVYYVSLAAGNIGHEPDTSPTFWAPLFSTLAPPYFSTLTTYAIGNFVSYLGTNYVCIAASTGNLPTNATFFAAVGAATTYASLIDFNLNNDPSLAPALWASGTTYATGNKVGAADGNIYSSVGNGNVGNNPITDGGVHWTNTGVLNPWTTVNPFGKGNSAWLALSINLVDLQIIYPFSAGPVTQQATKNAYRLPANYLRRAPQDPKAGSSSYLGAPSGLQYDDWTFQGNYLVTRETQPINLRFVADITDVTQMDDMFCEGLAARLAQESVVKLTQSTEKLAGIKLAYSRSMTEARLINGIETGPTEAPEDDYITCRV